MQWNFNQTPVIIKHLWGIPSGDYWIVVSSRTSHGILSPISNVWSAKRYSESIESVELPVIWGLRRSRDVTVMLDYIIFSHIVSAGCHDKHYYLILKFRELLLVFNIRFSGSVI